MGGPSFFKCSFKPRILLDFPFFFLNSQHKNNLELYKKNQKQSCASSNPLQPTVSEGQKVSFISLQVLKPAEWRSQPLEPRGFMLIGALLCIRVCTRLFAFIYRGTLTCKEPPCACVRCQTSVHISLRRIYTTMPWRRRWRLPPYRKRIIVL